MKKVVVITGATGTLGSKLLDYHYNQGDVVFGLSRCDHKIAQWSKRYPNMAWCLGDVRKLEGCLPPKADIVYHCAALKHVDMGENYPIQYHDVNYQGTINVFNHVVANQFVFFSTDKAVLPINFYGMSKALAEKHLQIIKRQTRRDIKIFRWGNIIGSQGSVIRYFYDQLKSNSIVNITHNDMTRFWLKIEDAIDFVIFHTVRLQDLSDEKPEVLIHPNLKAARVIDVVDAISQILGFKKWDYNFVGIRPGEKIHEHLKSDHDLCIRSDTAEKYSQQELIDILKPTIDKFIAEDNNV